MMIDPPSLINVRAFWTVNSVPREMRKINVLNIPPDSS